MLAALCTQAAAAGDDDWRLRITKEANGRPASFSGPTQSGGGSNLIKGSGIKVEKARVLAVFTKLRIEGPFNVIPAQALSVVCSGDLGDDGRPQLRQSVSGAGEVHRR